VTEERVEVDGISVFVRRAPYEDRPVLYVHGVPTNADDWTPFLRRSGGFALDLPGFGRSYKPAEFPYDIHGYATFLEKFVGALGIDRLGLVVHDWGAGAGLGFAQRVPDRIERLVVIGAVPLLPGYRWHRTARVWRTPVLGELAMGATQRFMFKLFLREAISKDLITDEFVDSIWDHFDQGTQRAILRLYRSAPPDVLAEAGRDLGKLTCPSLVVWGARDPYLPPQFADRYAAALGGETEVVKLDDAGHWPWFEHPELIDRIAGFSGGS
jgi:pimeloyl-ACP methyl ester carboxylesterase